jgi:curved DNA-binding protein CbpA
MVYFLLDNRISGISNKKQLKEISNAMSFILWMDSKGYYAILGVPEHSSYQEIKRAYRRLARLYHPDRNNSCFAEDMIKKINASFEVLSDKEKRRQYDLTDFNTIFYKEDEVVDNNNNYTRDQAQNYDGDDDENRRHAYSDFDNINHGNYYDKRKTSTDVLKEEIDPQVQTTVTDLDIPKGRFHIIVEPSLCMAFGSCETLAPKVFVVEKNKRINPKAVIESETGANLETILAAAQTCPTKAIKIIDRYTGEEIYP